MLVSWDRPPIFEVEKFPKVRKRQIEMSLDQLD